MQGAACPKTLHQRKTYQISTHAPHARRGDTHADFTHSFVISTHAPHARRGRFDPGPVRCSNHFYSRASCKARLNIVNTATNDFIFLLTRLMQGAAISAAAETGKTKISTHAPHARRGAQAANTAAGEANISTHAPHARRGLQGL